MKKVFLLLCASVLLGSCAVVHERTASRVALDPSLKQLPTMYELQVDEVVATKDTSWIYTFFSPDQTSYKQMVQNLQASLLAEHNADVLVAPKTSSTFSGNPFYREYDLTVSGYPAKYTNFHSITPEEMDMLYGPRCKDFVPCCEGPSRTKGVLPAQKSPKVISGTRSVAPAERKSSWTRKLGFTTSVEGGAATGGGRFTGNVTIGSQKSERFFIGGGLGVASYMDGYDYRPNPEQAFTLFADARFFFFKSELSPYIDLKLGLAGEDPFAFWYPSVGLAYKGLCFSLGWMKPIEYTNAGQTPTITFGFRF